GSVVTLRPRHAPSGFAPLALPPALRPGVGRCARFAHCTVGSSACQVPRSSDFKIRNFTAQTAEPCLFRVNVPNGGLRFGQVSGMLPVQMAARATRDTRFTAASPASRLGDRLRQLRVAAGLTQTDLAGDRFSKEYISQI